MRRRRPLHTQLFITAPNVIRSVPRACIFFLDQHLSPSSYFPCRSAGFSQSRRAARRTSRSSLVTIRARPARLKFRPARYLAMRLCACAGRRGAVAQLITPRPPRKSAIQSAIKKGPSSQSRARTYTSACTRGDAIDCASRRQGRKVERARAGG